VEPPAVFRVAGSGSRFWHQTARAHALPCTAASAVPRPGMHLTRSIQTPGKLTAVGDNPRATLQARLRAATSASLGRLSRDIPIAVWRNYGKAEDDRDQSTRAEG
jgi:hypothetical protein